MSQKLDLMLDREHAYRYTDEDGAHDYWVHEDGWLSYLDDLACRAPIDPNDPSTTLVRSQRG